MTESVEPVDNIDSQQYTPNPFMMIARPRLSSPVDLTTQNETQSAVPGFSPDELFALSKVTTARPTIVIYPTIPPETVIIPIVCSIIIFPILVAAIICFLRHYNRRARAKDKFRSAYQQGAAGLFSLANKIGTSKTVGRSKDSGKKRRQNFGRAKEGHCYCNGWSKMNDLDGARVSMFGCNHGTLNLFWRLSGDEKQKIGLVGKILFQNGNPLAKSRWEIREVFIYKLR